MPMPPARRSASTSCERAVYVFEKTVALYPDSWNAHDSLGEALLQAGRKEQAIEHYRKSLELNPRNLGAKKILQEFGG
ncbi:MAG: tetratricopeptide repeat protein [Candidatus Eisenbacteria bacterium]